MSRMDYLFGARAVPVLVEHHGRPEGVEYRDGGGEFRGVFQAILSAETAEEDDDGRRRRVRLAALPRQTGLPFWGGTPTTAGTLVVTEEGEVLEYAIEEVESRDTNFVHLRLLRTGSVRRGRDGPRR